MFGGDGAVQGGEGGGVAGFEDGGGGVGAGGRRGEEAEAPTAASTVRRTALLTRMGRRPVASGDGVAGLGVEGLAVFGA